MDPNLSLYDLIDLTSVQNVFLNRPAMLAYWCKGMENAIIDRQLQADVYAGFQYLSRVQPVLARYQKIGDIARQVWIFGQPDTVISSAPRLNFIYLPPEHKLIKEWFLVIRGETYTRGLLARELTPAGTPQPERRFEGVSLSDPAVITH